MESLTRFKFHDDFVLQSTQLTYPNVTLCDDHNEMHYNITEYVEPEPVSDILIKATFLGKDKPIQIMGNDAYDANSFKAIAIKTDASIPTENEFIYKFDQYYTLEPKKETYIYYKLSDNIGTYVPEGAFYYCSDLIEVYIPNNITRIIQYSFSYCENLKTVTIGEDLQEIGTEAFIECLSLSEIICYSPRYTSYVPDLGKNVFFHAGERGVLYVPDVDLYYNDEDWFGKDGQLANIAWSCEAIKIKE